MMSMRSKKRFMVFTFMYTALMIWMSYSLETGEVGTSTSFWIAMTASVVLSILYAWILINQEKLSIATLKCIGFTNNDIRTMIVGEILWVTTIAFVIVAEFLIHYAAIMVYLEEVIPSITVKPFIGLVNLVITLGVFVSAQLIGITLAYSKALKLRPIVALRVMK
jgi:ABC-type antimicrobial peptide transport system permease subunit